MLIAPRASLACSTTFKSDSGLKMLQEPHKYQKSQKKNRRQAHSLQPFGRLRSASPKCKFGREVIKPDCSAYKSVHGLTSKGSGHGGNQIEYLLILRCLGLVLGLYRTFEMSKAAFLSSETMIQLLSSVNSLYAHNREDSLFLAKPHRQRFAMVLE